MVRRNSKQRRPDVACAVAADSQAVGLWLDADAQGTAEPWAPEPKASVNLRIRAANLAPLFDLKPSDALAQNISLSSRVSLAGNKLTFDDLDSAMSGSRLRGRVAVTLDDEKTVDGEVGLDALDLAPAFALAVGATGHDASEPLGPGLLKGWRGRVAFQALRGSLPGGAELRPVSGTVKSDGQSLTFDAIKGTIGGGEATASIDAKQGADGIALNARVAAQRRRWRGAALSRAGDARRPNVAADDIGEPGPQRVGADRRVVRKRNRDAGIRDIAGLDPRAFETAIRASDDGQATDDIKLRQIVESVLSAARCRSPSAQIPFSIRDGRIRVGATALDGDGARAILSGGYDVSADQADIRATLASTTIGSATSHPEIQLFAVGSPDTLIAPSTSRRCRPGWR